MSVSGGQHGRARPDADPGLAGAQPHPFVVALAGGERRVQHRDDVAEAGLEAPEHLRGECDLGDEHDRRLAGGQRRLDRAEVDLGLARAGHPVQQEPLPRAVVAGQRGEQLLERRLLVVGERWGGHRRGADGAADRAAPDRLGRERHQTSGLQAPQPRRAELGGDGRAGVTQRGQQRALGVVERRDRFGPRRLGEHGRTGLGQLRDKRVLGTGPLRAPRRQHQRERPGRRRAVLAGHPLRHRHQFGRQPRADHRLGRRQPLWREL